MTDDLHTPGAKDDSKKINLSYLWQFRDAIEAVANHPNTAVVFSDELVLRDSTQSDWILLSKRYLTTYGLSQVSYKSNKFYEAIARYRLGLEQVCLVAELGEIKYSYGGWQSVPDAMRRYRGALSRHQYARIVLGEKLSEDLQLPHLAHETWNALALTWFSLRDRSSAPQ